MESHKIIQVEEKVPLKLLLPLSIQHMFAMFGATILVPILVNSYFSDFYFWNQSGNRTFYERRRNADFYCSDKSKVTGIFGVELRISCTGRCCYQ